MQLELSGVSLDLSFIPEEHHEKAKESITSAWEAGTSGLQRKNGELIQQTKDLKEQVRNTSEGNSAEAAIRLSEAQEEINGLKNDLQVAEHNSKQLASKLEVSEAKAREMGDKHDGLVKNTALEEQLNAVGVQDPHLRAAAKALLLADVALGEDGAALMGEKALSEAIAEWSESEAGKAFRSNGDPSGGGATNDGKGGELTGENPYKTGNFTEQAKLAAENPELAQRLETEAGLGFIPTPITQGEQTAV